MTWNDRYREAIKTGEKVFSEEPASSVVSALDTVAANIAPQDHQLCAVDVGAGEGRHSRELVRRGYKVVALEPSEAAVEHAANNILDETTDHEILWIAADMRDFKPTQKVDLVLLSFMHQREFSILTQLDHLDSWLNSGGWLVFVGHSRAQLGLDVGGPKEPERLWDPEELGTALVNMGYKVERAENVTREDIEKVEHAHHEDASIDAVVVAQKPVAR